MKNCCASCDAIFCEEGNRHRPLNPRSGKNYLKVKDYYEEVIYDNTNFCELALEAAKDIFTSCCPCVTDCFLCLVEGGHYRDAYGVIVDVYKDLEQNVPLGIRAFVTISNIWELFCDMVADELEIIRDAAADYEDIDDDSEVECDG